MRGDISESLRQPRRRRGAGMGVGVGVAVGVPHKAPVSTCVLLVRQDSIKAGRGTRSEHWNGEGTGSLVKPWT